MDPWSTLLILIILLGLATLLGTVAERLRQSAIMGFLVAGALVGPGGLNWVSQPQAVDMLAELGVALLLFTIGMEFSLKRLRALGAFAVGGGTLQIILTAALFALVARGFGVETKAAVALGLMIAPSSTACVMRLLKDRAELDSLHGRNCIGVLLLQDLALVPLVVLMTALGSGRDDAHPLFGVLLSAGLFVFLVLLFYGVSNYLLARVFRATASVMNRELLILVAATIALGASWFAHRLGFSPALGAFVAGLMIAESPYAAQVRADIVPLRTLFVTLFFVSIGMLGDLRWCWANRVDVALMVGLILAGKVLVVAVLSVVFRHTWREAVATALALAQVGEFSFVLGRIGLDGGVLDEDLFRLLISSILATMLLTPLMVAAAPRAGQAAERLRLRLWPGLPPAQPAEKPARELSGHVVVVGYGPAGREVVKALRGHDVPELVIELNPKGVAAARADGARAEVGDATMGDILEHVHLASARALVITIPDHRAALSVIRQTIALAPDTPIITRARYNKYVPELTAAGSHVTVDEEQYIGLMLGIRVIEMES